MSGYDWLIWGRDIAIFAAMCGAAWLVMMGIAAKPDNDGHGGPVKKKETSPVSWDAEPSTYGSSTWRIGIRYGRFAIIRKSDNSTIF